MIHLFENSAPAEDAKVKRDQYITRLREVADLAPVDRGTQAERAATPASGTFTPARAGSHLAPDGGTGPELDPAPVAMGSGIGRSRDPQRLAEQLTQSLTDILTGALQDASRAATEDHDKVASHAAAIALIRNRLEAMDRAFQSIEKRLDAQAEAIRTLHSVTADRGDVIDKLRAALLGPELGAARVSSAAFSQEL